MRVWEEEEAGTNKALARVRTRCEHMQREIYGACWRVLRHDIERGRAKMIMEERERERWQERGEERERGEQRERVRERARNTLVTSDVSTCIQVGWRRCWKVMSIPSLLLHFLS